MQVLFRVALGLFLVTLIGDYAYKSGNARLSADILARAEQFTGTSGADWARLAIAGRDITLSGSAPGAEARSRLVSAVDRLPGVRLVDDRSETLRPLSPYDWRLSRDGEAVAFAGAVPTEASRHALVAALGTLMPFAKLEDKSALASGAPDTIEQLHRFAAGLLACLGKGQIAVSDKTLRIEGSATTPACYASAQTLLAQAPAGSSVAASAITPPVLEPYRFVATKNGNELRLSGYAPSPAARDEVLSALRGSSAGISLSDELLYASPRQSESDWAASRLRLITQLLRLKDGRLSIEDGRISLSGVAPGVFEREQILAGLATLPAGMRRGDVAIAVPEPPPVDNLLPPLITPAEPVFPAPTPARQTAWAAEKTPGEVRLSGTAIPPLHQSVQRLFAVDTLRDETIAGTAPAAALIELVQRLLEYLPRFEEGRLSLEGTEVRLRGRVPNAAIRDEIAAAAAALPPGVARITLDIAAPAPPPPPPPVVAAPPSPPAQPQLTVPPPPPSPAPPPHPCQANIDDTARAGVINFATGDATLTPSSQGRLRAVAEALLGCADAKVEISGHTDDQGDPDDNLELSEERAIAVADWLVRAGIAAARLKVAGYGDTRPVASNDTAEGRAQNRRIEFRLY